MNVATFEFLGSPWFSLLLEFHRSVFPDFSFTPLCFLESRACIAPALCYSKTVKLEYTALAKVLVLKHCRARANGSTSEVIQPK